LYRLGEPALKNWDESIYAELGKEIVQTGDWLTLRWQHLNWFEKPPLTFWIIAGFFQLFGINEFWARAVSALAGVGVVAVVYSIGKLLRGPICGLIAALIILTTFQFVQMSRLVSTDVLLVFFMYLPVFGYLLVRKGDRRWWYLVSISCALGFMVKSFGSAFAPAAIILALVVDGQLTETLKAKHFWFSILAGLAVIVPWHAAMLYLHGSAFVNEYFYYHVWSRTLTSLEGHDGSYSYYFNEIWYKTHPWWAITPFAVVFHAWQVKRREFSPVILILVVLVFAFYTFAQTKFPPYILPAYPGLALINSYLLTWFWNRRRWAIRVAVILICVWFAYLAIGKIRPYYVRIEEWDVEIKELATQAAAQSSPPVLILYAQKGEFDPQAALFYSNKRVIQATGENKAFSSTVYYNYKPLAEVMTDEPAGIILMKDAVEPLRVEYAIDIQGETRELVYAIIRKKQR
jgi:4-amino-4-deoxy-L-arabinose transferase-like glycosyltransferase